MKKKHFGCGPYSLIMLLALALVLFAFFYYRQHILRYFYPLNYQAQVEVIAKEYEIDPWLIYAIIRMESDFKLRAESPAGARGLMQLMPSTAQWITEVAGFNLSEEDIWLPENNIRLGCWYIDWLRDYYNGDMVIAVAAYNAGMSNVNSWIASGVWNGNLQELSGIPFSETRKYISHVYESYNMYHNLYGE
ncbi:MAG: lytic transglycosylase domain-containing protein [Firmicutes bacterium]|nr:lytic transglycosylase domain-containing protein [Bacillota bacterium]